MVDFRAFPALRPPTALAAQVAAVPYDVVNTAEARALVADCPQSLLRVTRPDVDLPDGADMYAPSAYAAAQSAFQALLDAGALATDPDAGFYAYAQTMGDHRQVGVVGVASAADYWADRIKKHEHTRPTKEDDRMRHIEAVRAHLGPVFLAFREVDAVTAWLAAITADTPEVDFVAPDGIRHQLWPVFEPEMIEALETAFQTEVPVLYIADGHHRSAAAARIGRDAPAGDPQGRFLAVAFPADTLKILPYNRVVESLNGHSPEALLTALEAKWDITALPSAQAPKASLTVSMYLNQQWYQLTLKTEHRPDPTDPVARLDVSVVQDHILDPLLGIKNPRTAGGIQFVGGIRGLGALSTGADTTGGVAFALFPTSLDDLMDIADAGEVMPPKSTWFEPKLRSGLVISRY